jgi:hypothetical protein
MTDVETVRPLELLHRTAEMLGATVCLTATADRFQRRPDGDGRTKPRTHKNGSQLSNLVVVRPAIRPHLARWDCLARGFVLAQAEVVDAVTVDEVASVLVEELQARIAEAQKRASA